MGESSDSVSIDIDLIPLGGKVMALQHVISAKRTMIFINSCPSLASVFVMVLWNL